MKKNNLYFILIFSIIMVSCDHFDTRDSEKPINVGSSFKRPTSAEIVLSNLQSSFNSKNVVNFLRCFQDENLENTLKFSPAQDVLTINSNFFNNWFITDEERVLINIFNSFDSGVIPFLTIFGDEIIASSGTAQINAEYYLNINHNKQNENEKEYSGKLQFKLVNNANDYWRIVEWYDFNSTSSTITATWSKLKYNFGR